MISERRIFLSKQLTICSCEVESQMCVYYVGQMNFSSTCGSNFIKIHDTACELLKTVYGKVNFST